MKRILKKNNLLIVILALIVLSLSVFWRFNYPGFFQTLQNITFDSYQRLKPRTPIESPIRIVDIDEEALKAMGQWPWPRTRIAKLVDQLSDMGAAAIAFDVVFSERDRTTGSELIRQLDEIEWPGREKLRPVLDILPDNDQVLALAMERASVVLGFFVKEDSVNAASPNEMPEIKGKYAFGGDDPRPLLFEVTNSISALPILQNSAAGIGFANPSPIRLDNIVRRVPLFVSDSKSIHSALSVETLRVAQGASTFIIKTTSASGEIDVGVQAITQAKVGQFAFPLTKDGEFVVYFSPKNKDQYVSAHKVISGDVTKLRQLFEGHIVFVGTSAAGLDDLRKSPLGEEIPGVSIHAQIVEQILSGVFLTRPDWAEGAEVSIAAVVSIFIILFTPFLGAVVSAIAGGLIAAAVISVSWYAFSSHGLLLDPVYPTIVALAIFLTTTILRFAITENEKRFVRSAFQRYLAPNLLHKLEQSPDSLKLGGEIRNMTLMFMDIRGFTSISEKLSPQELVTFLNKLLSPLSDIIQENEGAIDKYIGDSIMAFWNAPLDVANHPRKAATAALKMLECLQKLNTQDAFEFKSERYELGDVQIGIGLNSGEGCVGNMGSNSRFDYSVVGDTVNVAARIESSCKGVGWPLLISQSTADACDGFAILNAGIVELKGKSEPAELFALIGDENYALSPEFLSLKSLHLELVAQLQAANWKNAGKPSVDLINKCIKLAPVSHTSLYTQMRTAYC